MRAAVAIVLALAGCTLFQDLPDKSCKTDDDCFRAQGERCDMATKECVVVPTFDAAPLPPDAAVDATATSAVVP